MKTLNIKKLKGKRGWLVGVIGGRDTVGGKMEKREVVAFIERKKLRLAKTARNTFVPAACIPCSRTCS